VSCPYIEPIVVGTVYVTKGTFTFAPPAELNREWTVACNRAAGFRGI